MKDTYPIISNFGKPNLGVMVGLPLRMRSHLAAAQAGDRDRESRLVNWCGRIRASCEASGIKFNELSDDIRSVMRESLEWLKTTDRVVNMRDPDPARWITTRKGLPRW